MYMYIPSKLCKMPCPLNHVLENFKYLLFCSTFWVVIFNGSLKIPKLLIHILIMLQKMTKNMLNYCLKLSLPFIFCHICYGISETKIFSTVFKVKLLVSKASNSCFKSLVFFQMVLASPNK